MFRKLLFLAGLAGTAVTLLGQDVNKFQELRNANAELVRMQREGSLNQTRAEQISRLVERRAAILENTIKSDPGAALDASLPEDVVETLKAAAPASSGKLETRGTWIGTLEYLIEDSESLTAHKVHRVLRTGKDRLSLNFTGVEPDGLQSGQIVAVSGVRVGNEIAAAPEALTMTANAGVACSTTGAQNVLVILVNLQNYKLGSGITSDLVKGIVLGNSATSSQSSVDYSVDDFWQQNSDGKTWVNRSGTGALTIAGPFDLSSDFNTSSNSCDTEGLRAAAIAAADPTVNLANFNRIAIVFPNQGGCGFAGLAYVGCSGWNSPQDGSYNAGLTWLRSDQMGNRSSGVQLWAHELGHTLGLSHAATRSFAPEALGALGAAGSLSEYGDPFSIMGAWNFGFYASPHVGLRLGWINYQFVETSGTYSIQAQEVRPGGTKALRIRRGSGNNAYLWLSYRQGSGIYSSTSPSQVFSGALIHYEDSNTGNRSNLLDFTPETGSFSDPALAVGNTWKDPYSNLSLTVNSAANGVLSVTVNYAGTSTPVCTRANPLVSVTGPTSMNAGATANFTVSVTNNDSSACSSNTFNLTSGLPSGWTSSINQVSLTLAPGASGTATLTKTAPSTATGTVTVDANATAGAFAGSGAASVSVIVPPPTTTNSGGSTSFTPLRVNVGGGATTDSGGNGWTADTGFLSGFQYTTSLPIANTTDQALYRSSRWDYGTLSASYAVPNGTYTVVLKFAENYFNSAGQRIFNIRINGNIVQTNFDMVQQAGGAFRAVDMTYTVTTSTGKIDIDLIPVLSNPSINGIQISASSSTNTSTNTGMTLVRVNAGGGTTTDSGGNAWTADTGFLNGYQYTTWQSITNTTDQALYQSARWNAGTLSASYAVPNGTYAVVLKFAENYLNSAGQRIFNIRINGNIVQTNFDIAQQAGGAFRAVDMTYTVTTSTGKIDIDLIPVLSNPSINGIQISASSSATTSSFTPMRVNAGGGTTTDGAGNAWTADTGFLNGYQYTTWQSITNTTDQALYQSARWNAGTLSASYAVPNGTYAVVLKFAENYLNSAGQRIFNIRINGNIVQTNFDIAQQAGGAFRAVDMTYTVTTSTGKIDIDLIPVLSNPSINGIQISASSSATTSSFTPMRVNAGGGTTTDGAGNAWTADTGFLNGYQYTTWQSITNTTDQALYQSARWNAGTLSASYAVPNGTYAVVLKFAENYLSSAGQRIFNIRINGNIVQTNFDIAQQAGGAFRAVDMTYTVTTSTGKIDIDLIPVLSNPSINGIQISAQ